MAIRSALKKKLTSGNVVLGTFVSSDGVDMVEILGHSGFDFVVLDMEHAPGSPLSVMGQMRAAESRGMDVVVRLPDIERTTVLRTLDIGVSGVLATQVDGAGSVRSFLDVSLYPPQGSRGFANTRATAYGFAPIGDYIMDANNNLLRVIQCETERTVLDIEEIVGMQNVDLAFINPYGLSVSLGVLGDLFHPKMVEAVDKVLSASKQAGKAAGILVSTPEETKKRIEQGFTFFIYSMDTLIFGKAARGIVGMMQELTAAAHRAQGTA